MVATITIFFYNIGETIVTTPGKFFHRRWKKIKIVSTPEKDSTDSKKNTTGLSWEDFSRKSWKILVVVADKKRG